MIVPGDCRDNLASVNSILKGKTRIVFKHLLDFNGSTQYRAVKCISRERKMATSTIKYALRKKDVLGITFIQLCVFSKISYERVEDSLCKIINNSSVLGDL